MKILKIVPLILAVLIISSIVQAVDMEKPAPLQVNASEEIQLIAEDIISVIHPLIEGSTVNFKPSEEHKIILSDDKIYNVGDFVLTPGLLPDQAYQFDTDFLTETATIAGYPADLFNLGRSTLVYIADVRNAITGEMPLVEPVMFADGTLDPYSDPVALLPSSTMAYYLSKFQNSEDIVLVSYNEANFAKIDGPSVLITGPIFYLKRTENGLYRLAGVLGKEGNTLKNDRVSDIEVLKFNNDNIEDIVVINNRHLPTTGQAFATYLLGQADTWSDVNQQFAWPSQPLIIGDKVFDAAVGSDRSAGGTWKDFIIIPDFSKSQTGWIAKKYISPTQLQNIDIGKPAQWDLFCAADEDCGPVRIECTRYKEGADSDIHDLNNDGCSDCVITYAKLHLAADNFYYFEPYDQFVVLLSETSDPSCQTYTNHSYYLTSNMPPAYFEGGNMSIPKAMAFSIEIANADPHIDDDLDIWIGDLQLYYNYETLDYDSFVFLYESDLEGNAWDIQELPSQVEIFDANYRAKDNYYVEDKMGGGVKAISADKFGNLGVVNGYPFVPLDPPGEVCPRITLADVPTEGPAAITFERCRCLNDRDEDGWRDQVPQELDIDGDGVADVFVDEVNQYVVCDPCILTGLFDHCTSIGNCQPHQKQCYESIGGIESCKNDPDVDGEYIKPPLNPIGCCLKTVTKVSCPANSALDYSIVNGELEAGEPFTAENDLNHNCVPDCISNDADENVACDIDENGDPFVCSEVPTSITAPRFTMPPANAKILTPPEGPSADIAKFRCKVDGSGFYSVDVEVDINGITINNDLDNDNMPDCEVEDGAFTGDKCDDVIDNKDFTCNQDGPDISVMDLKERLIRLVYFISKKLVKSAHAASYTTPGVSVPALSRSEADVLINKSITEEPPPEEEPPVTAVSGMCTMSVDRGEEIDDQYKPFRDYLRSLNDKFRSLTGLQYDPFVGEYASTYVAELYPPVSKAWLKNPQAGLSESQGLAPLYQYSGMKVVNYHAMPSRPVYLDYLVNADQPVAILPTPSLQAELSISMPSGVQAMENSAVQSIGTSAYSINGVMNLKYELASEGFYKAINANEAFLSRMKVSVTGVGGLDGCPWTGADCPVMVPSYQVRGSNGASGVDSSLFLKNVETLVERYKAEGKPITPNIILEALEMNRWDSTGYLEQYFSLVAPMETAQLSMNQLPWGQSVSPIPDNFLNSEENLLVSQNVDAYEEQGVGCYGLVFLIHPMMFEAGGAGGCKCNMHAASYTSIDIISILLIFAFVSLLYLRRKKYFVAKSKSRGGAEEVRGR